MYACLYARRSIWNNTANTMREVNPIELNTSVIKLSYKYWLWIWEKLRFNRSRNLFKTVWFRFLIENSLDQTTIWNESIFQLYWNFQVSNEIEKQTAFSIHSQTGSIKFSRKNLLILVTAYQRAFNAGIKAITNWMPIHKMGSRLSTV